MSTKYNNNQIAFSVLSAVGKSSGQKFNDIYDQLQSETNNELIHDLNSGNGESLTPYMDVSKEQNDQSKEKITEIAKRLKESGSRSELAAYNKFMQSSDNQKLVDGGHYTALLNKFANASQFKPIVNKTSKVLENIVGEINTEINKQENALTRPGGLSDKEKDQIARDIFSKHSSDLYHTDYKYLNEKYGKQLNKSDFDSKTWKALVDQGYVDKQGNLTTKFNGNDLDFNLEGVGKNEINKAFSKLQNSTIVSYKGLVQAQADGRFMSLDKGISQEVAVEDILPHILSELEKTDMSDQAVQDVLARVKKGLGNTIANYRKTGGKGSERLAVLDHILEADLGNYEVSREKVSKELTSPLRDMIKERLPENLRGRNSVGGVIDQIFGTADKLLTGTASEFMDRCLSVVEDGASNIIPEGLLSEVKQLFGLQDLRDKADNFLYDFKEKNNLKTGNQQVVAEVREAALKLRKGQSVVPLFGQNIVRGSDGKTSISRVSDDFPTVSGNDEFTKNIRNDIALIDNINERTGDISTGINRVGALHNSQENFDYVKDAIPDERRFSSMKDFIDNIGSDTGFAYISNTNKILSVENGEVVETYNSGEKGNDFKKLYFYKDADGEVSIANSYDDASRLFHNKVFSEKYLNVGEGISNFMDISVTDGIMRHSIKPVANTAKAIISDMAKHGVDIKDKNVTMDNVRAYVKAKYRNKDEHPESYVADKKARDHLANIHASCLQHIAKNKKGEVDYKTSFTGKDKVPSLGELDAMPVDIKGMSVIYGRSLSPYQSDDNPEDLDNFYEAMNKNETIKEELRTEVDNKIILNKELATGDGVYSEPKDGKANYKFKIGERVLEESQTLSGFKSLFNGFGLAAELDGVNINGNKHSIYTNALALEKVDQIPKDAKIVEFNNLNTQQFQQQLQLNLFHQDVMKAGFDEEQAIGVMKALRLSPKAYVGDKNDLNDIVEKYGLPSDWRKKVGKTSGNISRYLTSNNIRKEVLNLPNRRKFAKLTNNSEEQHIKLGDNDHTSFKFHSPTELSERRRKGTLEDVIKSAEVDLGENINAARQVRENVDYKVDGQKLVKHKDTGLLMRARTKGEYHKAVTNIKSAACELMVKEGYSEQQISDLFTSGASGVKTINSILARSGKSQIDSSDLSIARMYLNKDGVKGTDYKGYKALVQTTEHLDNNTYQTMLRKGTLDRSTTQKVITDESKPPMYALSEEDSNNYLEMDLPSDVLKDAQKRVLNNQPIELSAQQYEDFTKHYDLREKAIQKFPQKVSQIKTTTDTWEKDSTDLMDFLDQAYNKPRKSISKLKPVAHASQISAILDSDVKVKGLEKDIKAAKFKSEDKRIIDKKTGEVTHAKAVHVKGGVSIVGFDEKNNPKFLIEKTEVSASTIGKIYPKTDRKDMPKGIFVEDNIDSGKLNFSYHAGDKINRMIATAEKAKKPNTKKLNRLKELKKIYDKTMKEPDQVVGTRSEIEASNDLTPKEKSKFKTYLDNESVKKAYGDITNQYTQFSDRYFNIMDNYTHGVYDRDKSSAGIKQVLAQAGTETSATLRERGKKYKEKIYSNMYNKFFAGA